MTVHGTARWAEREELQAGGYLPAFSRAPAGQLLVGFWNDLTAIRYSGDLHQLIVGGTGGGKFTTALAPMLLSGMERTTVVAVDPKGEMAKLAGPYFQPAFAAKPSVFLLDPWDVCKAGSTHSLNVLDEITADNPNSVDDARALADAIVIPSGAENTHWDNAGRNLLTSVILYVALDPSEASKRDLVRVREIVTLPWQMPKAYVGPKQPTLMELLVNNLQSTVAGGAIKRGFSSLLNREEKERSGILSSVERDTAWIDSPQMEKVLQSDPQLELKAVGDGANKYFIVLPPEYFMTHRAWLRLMVTAFAKAMKRYQPSSQAAWPAWRHIIIDEFANLGEMSFILNEVAIARGYGVKYHFAVQDLSQLKRVYKDGWESFINNSFQRFFAIGDLFTAEYVSRMLGSATVESVSTSQGSSQNWGSNTGEGINFSKGHNAGAATTPFTHSYGEGRSESVGYSDGKGTTSGHSVSQIQRPLKTPDEVRRIHEGMQVVFFRGLHPVLCLRLPYWFVFPSLPPFTLKEVLSTIGRRATPNEIVHFTNWRMDGRMLKPRRRPIITWRTPRWLPDLSGYLLKAAVFLLVAGGLVYGFFEFLRSNPPSKRVATAAPTQVQAGPASSADCGTLLPNGQRPAECGANTQGRAVARRDPYDSVYVNNTLELAEPGRVQQAPESLSEALYRAHLKYEDDIRALARELEPQLNARLYQVGKITIEEPLRPEGLCQSGCEGKLDPELRIGIRESDRTILGIHSERRNPLSISRALTYRMRTAGGWRMEIVLRLTWRVQADASVLEQVAIHFDSSRFEGDLRSVAQAVLATRHIDADRFNRLCEASALQKQSDEAFACFANGWALWLYQQWPYPGRLPVAIHLPVPPCQPDVEGKAPAAASCQTILATKEAKPSQDLNPVNVPSSVNPLADKPVGMK
ncbi:MAG: type IV secretory system conjugative DNA transfer family protein [Alphaproteobacteria bacterium]